MREFQVSKSNVVSFIRFGARPKSRKNRWNCLVWKLVVAEYHGNIGENRTVESKCFDLPWFAWWKSMKNIDFVMFDEKARGVHFRKCLTCFSEKTTVIARHTIFGFAKFFVRVNFVLSNIVVLRFKITKYFSLLFVLCSCERRVCVLDHFWVSNLYGVPYNYFE